MAIDGEKLERLRILVVDDDPGMLELCREALADRKDSNYKFETTACSQGNEILHAVKESSEKNEHFAAILIDAKLLVMTGSVTTCERIRKLSPDVNLLVVSCPADRVAGEKNPDNIPEDSILYLKKPLQKKELQHIMSVVGAKWLAENTLSKTRADLNEKMAELDKTRKELVAHRAELQDINSQLMETNNALSVLARNLERTRLESENRIHRRIRTLVTPLVEKLSTDSYMEKYRMDLELLTDHINNLTSDFMDKEGLLESLSVTEMRIVSMIKNGMTSQEIARHLYISYSTVKTHRRNIRKKLNIKNSGTSLKVFLGTGK